jgi:hypothetical protein
VDVGAAITKIRTSLRGSTPSIRVSLTAVERQRNYTQEKISNVPQSIRQMQEPLFGQLDVGR